MKNKAILRTMTYYLSPNGEDTNAGTRKAPFATLERARDAVRTAMRDDPATDVRVVLRGGVYRFQRPAVFGLEDSAPAGRRIRYEAASGERVIFSAGIPVTGWKKASLPAGAPRSAEGRLWCASIPAGAGPCLTLYDGDCRLPRARTRGFTPVDPPPANRVGYDHSVLHFPEGAVDDWPDLTQGELVIRNLYPWSMNILPIVSVDLATRELRTGRPGTYPLTRLAWGVDPTPTAWVENVAAGLDAPGRWYVNRDAGLIYYWPASGRPSRRVVAPAGVELLRIEGAIDETGPVDQPVRGLSFAGITFTHGERYTFGGQTGRGIQHDWDVHDASTAMVRLRGADDCVFDNCRFTHAGGTGIRFDLHAQDNVVHRCEFTHLGGGGVVFAGYGQGLKDVNRHNRVSDCLVETIGELYWHAPGIFIWQSGWNRITNNELRHLPYSGIVVSTRGNLFSEQRDGESRRTVRETERDFLLGGEPEDVRKQWERREPLLHARFNTIERNLIDAVTRVMFDGNGIYISGTGRGNIVRENWVRNIDANAAEGIRCDDDQHDTLIESNIISRFSGGVTGICTGIVTKGVTHMVNNIIAYPVGPMNRGMISLERTPVTGSRIERNILLANDPAHRPYYQDTYYTDCAPPKLRHCQADRNIYYNTADPQWGARHVDEEREHGIEQRSLAVDPGFVDPDADDFRLRPDSPAHRLGFVPIPIHRIGRMDLPVQ